MSGLEKLRALAKRIGEYEEAGNHDGASVLWELLDAEVASMPVDRLRNDFKRLLIDESGSRVRLVSGVRGLFARAAS